MYRVCKESEIFVEPDRCLLVVEPDRWLNIENFIAARAGALASNISVNVY